MRLAVVSDTHLSPDLPAAEENWQIALGHVGRRDPDLVVHTGDLSADGSGDGTDLAYAQRLVERLSVPWRVVPGNHDLGSPDDERAVALERRRCYEEIVGHRFWSLDVDGWRLVGLDSQSLVADHVDDSPQWAWVEEQLSGDRPIIIFQHRPLAPTSPAEIDTSRRYHPEPGRSRMRALLAGSPVRAVVSGHVHQWRDETIDGIRFIWAPSTWATMPDVKQPLIGTKVVGLLELELGTGADLEARPVTEGFAQLTVGVTTPGLESHRRLSQPGGHR